MKRITIFIALIFGLVSFGHAQFLRPVPDMKGKFIAGGNVDFGLSGNYLHASIAPQFGYRVIHAVELGVRGSYTLECQWDRVYGTWSDHYFGAAAYTSIEVYRGLFAHGEYEKLYCLSRSNHQSNPSYNKWYDSFFVGAGYRSYSSQNNYVYLLFLYNLSWDDQVITGSGTPYGRPFLIRVGYCFGL